MSAAAPKTRPLISGETPMTGEERVAYLVKLAMEAFDAFHRGSTWNGSPVHPGRAKYERLVTERMRQGAMVWGSEVDCAGDSK